MSDNEHQEEETQLLLNVTIEPPDAVFAEVCGLDEEQIAEVISATLERLQVDDSVEVSVLITTDAEIRDLNREFRNIDQPTDVLSFPVQDEPLITAPADELWQEHEDHEHHDTLMAEELPDGASSVEEDESDDVEEWVDFEDFDGLDLGDIAISHEALARQAKEAGHSLGYECAYLLAHGVLHLVGYDDQSEAGYKAMVAHQEAILNELGITK